MPETIWLPETIIIPPTISKEELILQIQDMYSQIALAINQYHTNHWGAEDTSKAFKTTYTVTVDTLVMVTLDCTVADQARVDGLIGGSIRASASADAGTFLNKNSLMMLVERGQTWRINQYPDPFGSDTTATLVVKELI